MSNKVRHVSFYATSWIADTCAMSAEERGVYFSLCAYILDKNGPVPVDSTLPRRCGCSKTAFRRIFESLIDSNYFSIRDGVLRNPRCEELIHEAKRRMARVNIPRNEVFERDGYRCTYCGTTEGPFHCDHIMPVSRGGTGDIENLTTACEKCNRSKGALTLEEWRGHSLNG